MRRRLILAAAGNRDEEGRKEGPSYGGSVGSVKARANMHRLRVRMSGSVWLRGFHDAQHGRRATEKPRSAAVGGNVLVVAGAEAEKVAQFVVGPAEPGR